MAACVISTLRGSWFPDMVTCAGQPGKAEPSHGQRRAWRQLLVGCRLQARNGWCSLAWWHPDCAKNMNTRMGCAWRAVRGTATRAPIHTTVWWFAHLCHAEGVSARTAGGQRRFHVTADCECPQVSAMGVQACCEHTGTTRLQAPAVSSLNLPRQTHADSLIVVVALKLRAAELDIEQDKLSVCIGEPQRPRAVTPHTQTAGRQHRLTQQAPPARERSPFAPAAGPSSRCP